FSCPRLPWGVPGRREGAGGPMTTQSGPSKLELVLCGVVVGVPWSALIVLLAVIDPVIAAWLAGTTLSVGLIVGLLCYLLTRVPLISPSPWYFLQFGSLKGGLLGAIVGACQHGAAGGAIGLWVGLLAGFAFACVRWRLLGLLPGRFRLWMALDIVMDAAPVA